MQYIAYQNHILHYSGVRREAVFMMLQHPQAAVRLFKRKYLQLYLDNAIEILFPLNLLRVNDCQIQQCLKGGPGCHLVLNPLQILTLFRFFNIFFLKRHL